MPHGSARPGAATTLCSAPGLAISFFSCPGFSFSSSRPMAYSLSTEIRSRGPVRGSLAILGFSSFPWVFLSFSMAFLRFRPWRSYFSSGFQVFEPLATLWSDLMAGFLLYPCPPVLSLSTNAIQFFRRLRQPFFCSFVLLFFARLAFSFQSFSIPLLRSSAISHTFGTVGVSDNNLIFLQGICLFDMAFF